MRYIRPARIVAAFTQTSASSICHFKANFHQSLFTCMTTTLPPRRSAERAWSTAALKSSVSSPQANISSGFATPFASVVLPAVSIANTARIDTINASTAAIPPVSNQPSNFQIKGSNYLTMVTQSAGSWLLPTSLKHWLQEPWPPVRTSMFVIRSRGIDRVCMRQGLGSNPL
eukprot:TRINITY_DN11915_c0_g4_i1.p1 TRINITY_DN11915_c0_g4~~TRINITY_DN11915_c0_g4_i1.p1  ORF type:complete len:172 (+),score=15.66 TRINITY_DN11915_c0_g4_i1:610-1125(+)